MLGVIAVAVAAVALAATHGERRARIYWGAVVGGGQYGLHDAPWSMRSVDRFAAQVGKRPSLIQFSLPWVKCDAGRCAFVPFPTAQMHAIRAHGSIPVLAWASYAHPVRPIEPHFQLADVIDGTYDRFIRGWARKAKAWGHPFFLRFDREMNVAGLWPYAETRNGNRRGQFVRMWRHVHRIFMQVGATNVTWVWCPNVEYRRSLKPLRRLYPGGNQVDWTCLDGYNWGTGPVHPLGWRPFTRVFHPTYRLLSRRVAPGKPVMIGETASTEQGGSKAAWIRNMLSRELSTRFPDVKAVLYTNRAADGLDWPIESSLAATRAFAAGIRSRYYAPAHFGAIRESPIRPPG